VAPVWSGPMIVEFGQYIKGTHSYDSELTPQLELSTKSTHSLLVL